MADITGSPHWFWELMGYTIEREGTGLGTRRTIKRPDGSIVPVRDGKDRHEVEYRMIACELGLDRLNEGE